MKKILHLLMQSLSTSFHLEAQRSLSGKSVWQAQKSGFNASHTPETTLNLLKLSLLAYTVAQKTK